MAIKRHYPRRQTNRHYLMLTYKPSRKLKLFSHLYIYLAPPNFWILRDYDQQAYSAKSVYARELSSRITPLSN